MKRYKMVLRAQDGFLLGGVKVHESGWYETEEEAKRLLVVYVKANDEAGRKHDGGEVTSRWTKKALGKKSITGKFSKPFTRRPTDLVLPAQE